MRPWPTIVFATLLVAAIGCRNRPTQLDPFLGRTTVPPPPTGSVGAGGASVPALTAPPSGSVYSPPGGFGARAPSGGSAPTGSTFGTVAPPPSFSSSSTPARFTGGSSSTPISGGGNSSPIRVVEPSPVPGAAGASRSGLYTGAASGGVDIMDLPVSGRSVQPRTAEGARGVQQGYVSGGATAGVGAPSSGINTADARSYTLPGQEPAYGFDATYSQLNGRLEYSAADGRWLLRYITPGERTDRLGGVVVMTPASPVTGFRNGDMVTVRGRIENDGGGRSVPIYSAATVAPQRTVIR